jgi:anti-sigma factor RsiW
MNCQEVDQSLAAYLHGEVGRSERELIRAHIAQCPRCQNELSRLSKLQSDLARSLHAVADSAAPSPMAWTRLQARLTPRRHPTLADRMKQAFGGSIGGVGNWAVPRALLFLASTAIVSAVTIGLFVWPRSQPQPTAVATPAPAIAPSPVPTALPAVPLDVPPAGSPAVVRRISGPIYDLDLSLPMADVPVVPDDDSSDVPAVRAGDWNFVQVPELEGAPIRMCASCTMYQ